MTYLPLRRFSARSCNIKSVDIEFLQSFRLTLEKLDLSCNPLGGYVGNITHGVRNSNLTTLILDHIIKAETVRHHGGQDCIGMGITNSQLEPLSTVPLRVFSIQANGLTASSKLNLRQYCRGIVYMDLSHNFLNGTSFLVAQAFEGQEIPESVRTVFHNPKFVLPSVRYMGLRDLGNDKPCQIENTPLLHCEQESNLFLEDSFVWNRNNDPNIMDFMLMMEMIQEVNQSISSNPAQMTRCILSKGLDGLDECLTELLFDISQDREAHGKYYSTQAALNRTIMFLWNEIDGKVENLPSYLQSVQSGEIRYLLANLTTLSMGNNVISTSNVMRTTPLCSNIRVIPNNLMTIDLSGSELGFMPCRNISGLNYLQNLTLNDCKVSGWYTDIFPGSPIRYIHMKGVKTMRQKIEDSVDGSLFKGFPGLEILDMRNIGIRYFSDVGFLTYNPKLTHLLLTNNSFRVWNVTLNQSRHLQELDLRFNSIAKLSSQARSEITTLHQLNNLQVYFEGNDIECSDCTSNFMFWLLNTSAIADIQRVRCRLTRLPVIDHCQQQSSVGQPKTSAVKHQPLDSVTDGGIAAIVVSVCAILGVIIIIVIAYNKRYQLIYYLERCNKLVVEEQRALVYLISPSERTDTVTGWNLTQNNILLAGSACIVVYHRFTPHSGKKPKIAM